MDALHRFGTCSKDCYGSCAFTGFWDDNAKEQKFLFGIPKNNHPFTNGFFCPKYKRRQDLLYHPDRLKKPLIRIGPKSENLFKSISSQKALETIAQKINEIIISEHPKSIIGAFYAGNSGLISQYAPLRFFGEFGATITSGGICNEGGIAGLKQLFGTYSFTNPFQINSSSTRLIVVWGSNLSENNNHAYFLVKRAVKKGARLVVIDSRYTKIAEKSDIFLHIHPGTEHFLAKLLIKALFEQGTCDIEFLKECVDSYSKVISEITDNKTEISISQIGIKNTEFIKLVDILREFKHQTLFMVGYGVQKDFYGGKIVQAIALIQVVLGNIGKPGTGFLYSQSDFMKPIIKSVMNYITNPKGNSRFSEINLIELGNYLRSGDFKLLFIYNLNPVSSLPNQNNLRKALTNKKLFTVVLDMFLNETTKYADIVIPAKFDLETSDLIVPYYIPSLSINSGGPCPYSECMSNYEFFQQLGRKLDNEDSLVFNESEEQIFNKCLRLLPAKVYEDLKSNGYYLLHSQTEIPFQNLKFPTPNNKIQAGVVDFEFGKKEYERKFNRELNEFILITPSHGYFLHSQLGQLNNQYLKDFGRIYLNSNDIAILDLKVGEKVHISNEYGSAHYLVAEHRALKSGIALIYSGASSPNDSNVNVNIFTPDIPENLGKSGSYNSAIVRIQKLEINME